jgi:ABC-2 type transport system ATP-binding protein
LTEILADGLVKRFGRSEVLSGVSLSVPSGGLHAVVGADGSGKTTLMRCLVGLYRADAGRVAPGAAGQERLGFAPQGFHLYGELTVDENLTFFGSVRGLSRHEIGTRIEQLLAFAGLGPYRTTPAGTLSGGMQRKLTLACALLHGPPLLLLDEPTAGVDPLSRRELWELLEMLHADGATILLSSAYLDEVERCEHVVFLQEGRVLASGPPEQLRGSHSSLEDALVELLT